MEKKLPKVVVGVPVYNEERYIGELLESIVNQTYPNMMIIVSDNCSKDDSWSIIQEYARKDNRVIAIRQAINKGVVYNFTHVFSAYDSEYFIWAGGHDRWDSPDMIESCVKIMEDDISIALCVPLTKWIDSEGNLLFGKKKEYIDTRNAKSPAGRVFLMYSKMYRCSAIYGLHRRSVLETVFPFPKDNDTIGLFRIAESGNVQTNMSAFWCRRIIRRETDEQRIKRYRDYKIICTKSALKPSQFVLSHKTYLLKYLHNIKGNVLDRFCLSMLSLWKIVFEPTQFMLIFKMLFSR